MSYTSGDFDADATRTARTMHLTYRRCQYLLDRWWSGLNEEFPSQQHPEMNNLMTRVSELVSDYEANGNAKLNTIMAKSDLVLPGE